MAQRTLPTGTVTFLFTDIEGSTRLARAAAGRWSGIVEDHNRILRGAVEMARGAVVRTEGDAVFAAFPDAVDAVHAAVAAQRTLAAHPWPPDSAVRVRMGLHTGRGVLGGDDYVGVDVHEAARVAGAGHGGQVVLTAATRALVEHELPEGVRVRELGEHLLENLDHPTRLHDLEIDGLPSFFPPLREADAPGNLAEDRTSFIGRAEEVARILGLLERERLVTLTGPGGTGKTRLALRAGRAARGFTRGAWFVDLSPIREPDLVLSAIADALGVHPEGSVPVIEAAARRLADGRTLLLLDNLEQVPDAPDRVAELLDRVSGVSILATSRAPLRLSRERELPVGPLSLEGDEESDAARLFVERAASVGRELDGDEAVRELCRRLDGLPLAIELAATRTKLLTPGAILERLGERLDLLSARARDVPERQRTLRAAIAWSEELLGDAQRRLFAALSVFSGGCTIAAAESVCGPAVPGLDIEDGLEALLDHSLIRRRGDRLDMLETIRDYGRERLAETELLDQVAERHAAFFTSVAEEAEPHLTKRDREALAARIQAEEANLRAVLRYVVAVDRGALGCRLVGSLWRYWQMVGRGREGAGWARQVLALPSAAEPSRERVRALLAQGNLAYWLGDQATMLDSYTAALDLARDLSEPALEAEALADLGFASIWREEPDEAIASFAASARLRSDAGDRVGVAWTRVGMAIAHGLRKDHDAMLPLLEEAEATFEEADDLFGLENVLGMLATIEFERGEIDRAEERIRRLLLATQVDVSTAAGLSAMANIALARSDPERAMRLWGAVEGIADAAGGGRIPSVLVPLGDTRADAAAKLDPETASALAAEGRAMDPADAIAYALGDDG